MKRFMLIATIAVLSVSLIALSTSYAKGRDGRNAEIGPGPGHDLPFHALKMHAAEIGLSEKQLTSLEALFVKHEKELINLKAELKVLHIDLRTEMTADVPDQKLVTGLVDKINDLDGKIRKARIINHLQAKSILTPEQHAKLKAIRSENRQDRMERRNERQGDREDRRMRTRDRDCFIDDNDDETPSPEQM